MYLFPDHSQDLNYLCMQIVKQTKKGILCFVIFYKYRPNECIHNAWLHQDHIGDYNS
jgi:hypothetical protein